MLFHSAWKVLTLLVIADFTASYWLACSFQANHVVDEVEWYFFLFKQPNFYYSSIDAISSNTSS